MRRTFSERITSFVFLSLVQLDQQSEPLLSPAGQSSLYDRVQWWYRVRLTHSYLVESVLGVHLSVQVNSTLPQVIG